MEFRWAIEFTPGGSISPAGVAQAVAEFGPGVAVLVDHGAPVKVLPSEEIVGDERELPVSELHGWRSLEPTRVRLADAGAETVFVRDDLGIGVVDRGSDHLVVPLTGELHSGVLRLASSAFAIAADAELPGHGATLPRMRVPYRCEHGHVRWQWREDVNRRCGGGCDGTLRRT